jgi:hypothetical protein
VEHVLFSRSAIHSVRNCQRSIHPIVDSHDLVAHELLPVLRTAREMVRPLHGWLSWAGGPASSRKPFDISETLHTRRVERARVGLRTVFRLKQGVAPRFGHCQAWGLA